MRIVFAGTPALAVPTLEALVAAGHDIVLVITREDAPRGRKRELTPSEVAVAAEGLGLEVRKTNRIGPDDVAAVRVSEAELGVVVAYGAIFREDMLAAPKRGWINLHFSLLPRWRGAAPVPHSILNDEPLGVSVFQLEQGVDDGPLWAQCELSVEPRATAGAVLEDFAVRGAPVVLSTLEAILDGASPSPQQGEPSHARKLTLSDAELHPVDGLTATVARFRAVTPEPGAWVTDGDSRLKILEATPSDDRLAPGEFASTAGIVHLGTGDGSLRLERVQPAGKAAMSAADWWRGRR